MTLQGNRLNALNLQLIQVRAERAAAEARIEVARKYRASDVGADAFADVLRSSVVQNLRQQGAQIERAIQDLNNSGATQSAQFSSLKVQQESLQRQMNDEISRIIESLASEVEVILRREKDIERSIAETWERTAQESKDLVRLQQLEREANANRTIYESFLNRYKQTIEQEGFVAPEARLISSAEVPMKASGTNPLATLVFSLMAGAIGAGGLALAVDRLDRRVRSGLRLEEMVGLPVIGRVPNLTKKSRLMPHDQVVAVPGSAYSEAIRRLAVALQWSRFTTRAKVVVVTSSEQGEGKSTTCVSLARTLAATGKKVIVVDTDLHRPNVAAAFGYDAIPSLNDLVSGGRNLLEIVCHDDKSGADFIAAKPVGQQSQEILQGSAFKALIRSLRERYDYVIMDSPPVCAAVDAVLVAAYADAVLLTVRWGVTSELTVLAALDELNIFSVPVAGIVLNGVDPHSQSYEAMYPLFDHRTSAPVRRQQGRLSEEAGVRSMIHLKTANVTRLNSTGSDYPSTPPM
jgi:capsular exopolysaccharide synthesis family protein